MAQFIIEIHFFFARKKNVFEILYFDVLEFNSFFVDGNDDDVGHTVCRSTHYEANIWLDTVQIFISKKLLKRFMFSFVYNLCSVWPCHLMRHIYLKKLLHHLAKKIINHFFHWIFQVFASRFGFVRCRNVSLFFLLSINLSVCFVELQLNRNETGKNSHKKYSKHLSNCINPKHSDCLCK